MEKSLLCLFCRDSQVFGFMPGISPNPSEIPDFTTFLHYLGVSLNSHQSLLQQFNSYYNHPNYGTKDVRCDKFLCFRCFGMAEGLVMLCRQYEEIKSKIKESTKAIKEMLSNEEFSEQVRRQDAQGSFGAVVKSLQKVIGSRPGTCARIIVEPDEEEYFSDIEEDYGIDPLGEEGGDEEQFAVEQKPRLGKTQEVEEMSPPDQSEDASISSEEEVVVKKTPATTGVGTGRKRGRPRKIKDAAGESEPPPKLGKKKKQVTDSEEDDESPSEPSEGTSSDEEFTARKKKKKAARKTPFKKGFRMGRERKPVKLLDNVHLVDPTSKRHLPCPYCPGSTFTYKNYLTLNNHIKIKHVAPEDQPYKCPLCPKGFVSNVTLQNHVKFVHEKVRLQCPIPGCTKSFQRESFLREHLSLHRKSGDGSALIKCKICGKGCSSAYTLKNHMIALHQDPEPVACDKCGKEFPNIFCLRSHRMKVKNCVASYKCSECEMAFKTNLFLANHMKAAHDIVIPV